jgi:HSP20 family protein
MTMAEEKTTELQEATPMRVVSPFDEMDRLFDRLIARRGWMRPWRTDWPSLGDAGWVEPRLPRIDIVDREDDIVVRAEVPGIEKKELDISVGEDSVTLRGETQHEEKAEAGDLYRCEISRGAFSRTVGLPAAVDGSKAKAVFHDGVLTLTLPKVERARRHTVKVD